MKMLIFRPSMDCC